MRRTPSSSHLHLFSHINGLTSSLFRQGVRRRVICLALIMNLFIWPGTGIPAKQFSAFASTGYTLTTDSVRLLSLILESVLRSAPARPQHETLADRLAYVSRIRISPLKYVGYIGEEITLAAVATDSLDRTVQGVRFTWESSNTDKVQIDEMGRATFLQPGLSRIICRAGSAEATAAALVRPGRRPRQTDDEWRADQSLLGVNASPSNLTGTGGLSTLLPALLDDLSPTASAQNSWVNDLGYDELWSEPRNMVGSPRNGVIEPIAIGSVLPEGSNFEWAIPLISLSGRGLNTNLSLYYNSRVWSRRNSTLAFDAIAGWPAPGFSLGFGRIVFYNAGTTVKYMLIDPDGTHHSLSRSSPTGPLETTDGTHIVYQQLYDSPALTGGELHYPDGTTAVITLVNNRLLPTGIYDKSGNYIQIAYKSECSASGTCDIFPPMAIDYIVDTLGRHIEFQYDSSGRLTSITRPGFGGTAQNPVTQTVVQFDYQPLSASTNFTGLTVERGLTWSQTLKHIYFPATGTGYKPSYSQYGMIYNISARRGMTSSTWPAGSPPAITDGVESASVAFNYPISSQSPLTDAPAFTQRTETAVNSPQGQYTYTPPANPNAQSLTFTIARPDSTSLVLTRLNNSASPGNGLLIQSEIKVGSSSLARTELNYVYDRGGSPQVQSVTSYDDTGAPVKADFDYDQYGNISNMREYGYKINGAWQVRRRMHYTYKTDPGYIGAYLRGLVTLVELFDARQDTLDSNDDPIARTSFAYDNFVAMGGVENYGGPAEPPPGHINSGPYGKVTGVTEWVDFSPTPTVIQHLARVDIFGNVVKAQVNCCQQKDLTNTDATYWSQPEEVMSGDPNGVHQTTSTDYDFNTSLAKSRTDATGLVTNFGYDALLLSPSSIMLPTGAGGQRMMDYGTLSSTSSWTYEDGGVTKTLTSTTRYDGWGRVIQTIAANNAQVNTVYDAMGRVISRTNPFTAGGTPGPSTMTQYDIANRAVITRLPDGNTVRTDYSGNTVTATDQVGRKIKRESDGLGRLVKVSEQDATGALTQETSYNYSLLDKLTLVNQSGQQRSYKYDALGRLLFERIPEQSTPIKDGTGAYWSTKYTYTEFGALSTKQDARGVITSYGYDALHRINSISYDTTNAYGVATTPAVIFGYDAGGSLSGVTVGNQFTETYSFDSLHRVQSVTRWILGRVSDSRKAYTTTYEYNEANQLTKISYPSSFNVDPSYDDKGRPTSLLYDRDRAWLGGYMTNLTYNTSGQVSGWSLGNGVAETYAYDSQRLQMISQTATKGGNMLMNLTYGYQATAGQNGLNTTASNSGQLMSVSGTINSTTESASYTYDLLGRLASSNQSSNGVNAQRRFAYDRWGNRTGVWNAATGGTQIQSFILEQSEGAVTNRITSVTNSGVTSNYTYDAAGNVTNDGQHIYQYDAENRIVSVDSGAAQYFYDHQNRRVCKIIGTAWTHYIYEGNNCIAEHDGTQSYTTNPSYQVNSARVDYVYSGSRVIYRRGRASSTGPWATNYYLSDRLSVRLALDASGNVVGRQAHLPYGEDFAESGTQEKHHFTSYERDSESGSDYAINRQYSQVVGKFMRVDPYAGSYKLDKPQSLNRYAYVSNNPVNAIDPSGLNLRMCFWTVDLFDDGEGHLEFGWRFDGCFDFGGGGGGQNVPTPPQVPDADYAKIERANRLRKAVKDWVDSTDNKCKGALNDKGYNLGIVKDAAENVPFFDVNEIGNLPATQFFGKLAQPGQSVSGWYAGHIAVGMPLANTPEGKAIGGTPGIYARGGVDAFYSGPNTAYYYSVLHELMHYTFGIGDQALATKLGVERRGRGKDKETWSQALSRYFNGGCDGQDLGAGQ